MAPNPSQALLSPGVFLSWLSSLGSSHASVANMFPGLTGERDDSVIES